MELRWRVDVAACKTVPSSATVQCGDRAVTVLANGSQFLYFIDLQSKKLNILVSAIV